MLLELVEMLLGDAAWPGITATAFYTAAFGADYPNQWCLMQLTHSIEIDVRFGSLIFCVMSSNSGVE